MLCKVFATCSQKQYSVAVQAAFSFGKDHSSHRLVAMGLSQREAVMAICLICGTLGMLAVFLTQASIAEGYAIGAAVILAGLFGLWKLERVKGLE